MTRVEFLSLDARATSSGKLSVSSEKARKGAHVWKSMFFYSLLQGGQRNTVQEHADI